MPPDPARRGGRYQGTGAPVNRQAASADQRAAITIWVWMVYAISRPDASVTRVCHTIVVRPR